MCVEPLLGVPSRFHDANGRVVATAELSKEWDGLLELDGHQYGFSVGVDTSEIRDRMNGRRAMASSLDDIIVIVGTGKAPDRYELVATGPDRFGLYRRDRNVSVLNHVRIGHRIETVNETSTPAMIGLLATLIVAFAPPHYTRESGPRALTRS